MLSLLCGRNVLHCILTDGGITEDFDELEMWPIKDTISARGFSVMPLTFLCMLDRFLFVLEFFSKPFAKRLCANSIVNYQFHTYFR